MFELLLLDAGASYILDFLNKIIASNSLGLMFSVGINVLLYKGYKSEKDYNRERDLAVTKIVTLMQDRLGNLKRVEELQGKQILLVEQLVRDVERLQTITQ